MKFKKIGNTVMKWISRHIWYCTKKGTVVYIAWDVFRIIRTNITWFSVNFNDEMGFMTKCGGGKVIDIDGNDLSEIYGFYGWNLAISQWSFFQLVEPREMLEDGSDLVRYTIINDSWQLYIGKKRIK